MIQVSRRVGYWLLLAVESALAGCGSGGAVKPPVDEYMVVTEFRGGNWDILEYDKQGRMLRVIADGSATDWNAEVSHDGTTLAYTTSRYDGSNEVVVQPYDLSSAPVRLAPGLSIESAPKWSPGDSLLAFVSNRDSTASAFDVWVYNVKSRSFGRVTHLGRVYDEVVSWYPDGRRVLFAYDVPGQGARLYSVDVVTGALAPLEAGGDNDSFLGAVSPNGQQVVFATSRWSSNPKLAVLDLPTGGVRQLTFGGGTDLYPAWSLSEDLLSFSAQAPGAASRVFLVRPDGTNLRELESGANAQSFSSFVRR